MMRKLLTHKWLAALVALLMASAAQAQLNITITEGNAGALPVVVVPFTFEGVVARPVSAGAGQKADRSPTRREHE